MSVDERQYEEDRAGISAEEAEAVQEEEGVPEPTKVHEAQKGEHAVQTPLKKGA